MKYIPAFSQKSRGVLLGFLALTGLYFASLYNFLLFHAIAELASIAVAYSLFLIAWNSRHFNQHRYAMFLGIAYFFVGSLDLVHTLAYKGMNIFPGYGADLPTQIWIAARYIEGLSLLAAVRCLKRPLNAGKIFGVYSVISLLLLVMAFTGLFPVCYREGSGLTTFKIVSEYLIVLILFAALITLFQRRAEFSPVLFKLMAASITLTICAELAFTFYISVYGLSNLIGHYFKLLSFYLIYKAIIETGLKDPYSSLFHDLVRSKEALRKNEIRYQKAQELGNVGNWEYNIQTTEFWGSEQAKRIYGFDPKAEHFSTDDVENCIPERERVHQALIDLIERHQKYDLEFEIITYDTQERKTIVSLAELERDRKGNPLRVTGVVQDITDRKRAEEALRESETYLKKAEQMGQIGHWLWDVSGDTLTWSEELYHIFDVDNHFDLTYQNIEAMIHPEDRAYNQQKVNELLTSASGVTYEFRITRPNGSIRWIHLITEVVRDESRQVARIFGIMQDITDRKQAEAQLKAALKEKEVLLQEVYHRVKNNLMVVQSLIDMQAEESTHSEAIELFRDLRNRVMSMSMVHEDLYQSESLSQIEFGAYLERLVINIRSGFAKSPAAIKVFAPDIFLDVQKAVPCGLIVAELVTNAFKYAFVPTQGQEFPSWEGQGVGQNRSKQHEPDEPTPNPSQEGNSRLRRPEIRVEMLYEEPTYTLIVSDNGVGLPPDFDMRKMRSLGMTLVRSWATHQLKGKIDVDSQQGTQFMITFQERT